MLVISRKTREAIHIGNDIVVYVTEIRGDKVRLAIEAPKNIPIVRPEAKLKVKQHECDSQENA